MKRTLNVMLTLALVALPAGAAMADSCGSSHAKAASHAEAGKDIVETAVAAGTFKTLAAALTAAELVDVLKGEGPFTVFAPSDEAFAKLPAGTVEELLKPENREKLTRILTYHVVSGKVTAADVMKLEKAEALSGDELRISAGKKGVQIDEAMVAQADIMASNGVIHVIDSVLLPN